MTKNLDRYEREMLAAYEKGALISLRPTKAQLAGFREAARATFVKSRRVNIRLSAADLMDASIPRPSREDIACRKPRPLA